MRKLSGNVPRTLRRRVGATLGTLPLLLSLLGGAVVTFDTGCSTKTTTVTTERVNEKGEREIITTTTEPKRSGGIVSSVVGVVGDILAFPFRLVAGIVQIIF